MAKQQKSRAEHIAQEIVELSQEELEELGRRIAHEESAVARRLSGALARKADEKPRRSIMELRGLGKEIWKDIDVEAYLNEERNSWE